MNWEAIGSIAEALGAAGVIATLLYLAFQVRQNTRVAKADFFYRTVDGVIDFNLRVAESDHLADLFWKALEDPGRLSASEERRTRHLLSGVFRQGERVYYAWRDDLVGEDIFRAQMQLQTRLARTPGGQRWLEDWGPGMDPQFVKILLETDPTPPIASGRQPRTNEAT